MQPHTYGNKPLWLIPIVAIFAIILITLTPSLSPSVQIASANAATPRPPIDMLAIRSSAGADLSVHALADGSISGVVTDQDTGLPIEGVEAWAWASESNISFSVCTGSDGSYAISGLPLDEPIYIAADSWYICPGPANYPQKFWQDSPTFDGATPITLSAGNPSETDINFALEEGYVVTGTVFETNGSTPIEGALVYFSDADSDQTFGGTFTNASGSFSMALYEGNYHVDASADGYALEYYDEAGQDGDNATTLAVSGNVGGVDFTLDPGGTISGQVTTQAGGAPLANVPVDVADAWIGTCTDSNGEYTLTGLALNTPLKIQAAPPSAGWCEGAPTTYVTEWWQEALDQDSAMPITLTSGAPDVANIDFTLEEGNIVSGTVYETNGSTPIANAWTSFEIYSDQAWMDGVSTDQNGVYSIVLPDGTYRASAGADGYTFEFYDEAGQNGYNATQLVLANDVSGVDFTLDAGGSISGQVTLQGSGTPLENIWVTVDGEIWTGSCTDSNGEYEISGLPLDTPIKVQSGPDWATWCQGASIPYEEEWWEEAPDWDSATPVTLTAATPNLDDIDFTLSTGSTFTDVPVAGKEWMEEWIDTFYDAGITSGCATSPLRYCPEREVTRAEMAVFILRALNYPSLPYTPPSQSGTFADMPVATKDWMENWVEEFYDLGITSGCMPNPLSYCPERAVTRAEMAVFILRAINGPSWTPPAQSGTFADVPVSGKEWMEPWIEAFYDAGITTGCMPDPLSYCPEREVTRAEMAVFILRAFDSLPSVAGWSGANYSALRVSPTPTPTATFTMTPTPTATITATPTIAGTLTPSPTITETNDVTLTPTATSSPTPRPETAEPTEEATPEPTIETPDPTEETPEPTDEPTTEATEPTEEPSLTPTTETPAPTGEPTPEPTTETPEPGEG